MKSSPTRIVDRNSSISERLLQFETQLAMKTKLVLVISSIAACSVLADVGEGIHTFTTLSGKTYRGVLVSQVSPDGVSFRHANGAGKVLFADLPSDVRQSLGYDAGKAEAYEKDLAARRERDRIARMDRDKEIAKAWAGASAAAVAQAGAIQAQYIAAMSQQQASTAGCSFGWPVWGGYGWYTEQIPSPSYGGRAHYTVRRRVGTTGVGAQFQEILGYREKACAPARGDYHHTANYSVMSPAAALWPAAGQINSRTPYSGNRQGTSAFTNGVPALNSSFVPSPRLAAPRPVAGGPAGRMAAPPPPRGK